MSVDLMTSQQAAEECKGYKDKLRDLEASFDQLLWELRELAEYSKTHTVTMPSKLKALHEKYAAKQHRR